MAQTFGIEAAHAVPQPAVAAAQPPARYLVLIDSASHGTRQARLFLATREQVAEFDAAGPEVQSLTSSLLAGCGADAAEWDTALAGHSRVERQAAQVFTLGI